MNSLDFLIAHCTATPAGRKVTKDDIIKWHTSPPPIGRGWTKLGYSDMIMLDGSLVNLTPYNQDNIVDPWEITNGAVGINSRSRHFVYVGGLAVDPQLENEDEEEMSQYIPFDTRTQNQKEAMEIYVKYMILRHPQIKIAGHYDFSEKACPSFNVQEWAKSIGVKDENIFKK